MVLIASNPPQNLKFRKYSKRFIYAKGVEQRVSRLRWGARCGLVACKSGILTPKQLQTTVTVINKILKPQKRKRKSFFCSTIIRAPITRKPLGTRMGRGKGGVDRWIVSVPAGRIIFQIYSRTLQNKAVKALRSASFKLPIVTKLVVETPCKGVHILSQFTRCS